MKLVISFRSLVDETNKGYFLRINNKGFSSVKSVDNARIFKSKNGVNIVLDKLKEKEGKFYKFDVWEILENEN